MAEALCGSSNALQDFRKHTSADRTLQRDRISSSRKQEQGFRSSGPAARALDAEFHAFQASQIQSVPLQRAQLPLAHIRRYATPPTQQALPDWAADFQKLNVSSPSISAVGDVSRNVPISSTSEWYTDFAAMQNTPQTYIQPEVGLQNQWQPQFQGFNPYMDNMYGPSMQQMHSEQILRAEPQLDDAFFARAFEEASAEIQETFELKGKEKSSEPEDFNMGFACTDPGDVLGEYDFDAAQLGLMERSVEPAAGVDTEFRANETDQQSRFTPIEVPRIGADTIAAKDQSEALNPQAEADELSRTAGHLLDTLKDEKNTKFQQSSFLALMRQLRDKEIKVEGDKMVPVTSPAQPSHPGGRYYPYDAFERSPLNGNPPSSGDRGPPVQHYYPEP